MKSGWQKLKKRREKEERAKRGRQLVTQLFANKEGGGQDPPTATTTGSHFGEGGSDTSSEIPEGQKHLLAPTPDPKS
ncbi:unnamed protein product [Gadus morhua 'NCC']